MSEEHVWVLGYRVTHVLNFATWAEAYAEARRLARDGYKDVWIETEDGNARMHFEQIITE